MANDDIVQVISDAREDAISLSQFIYYPATVTVNRRLAPPIHTLEYYLQYLEGLEKVYSQPTGTVDVNGEVVKTVRQSINDAIDSAILGDYQTMLESELVQEVVRATNRENEIEDALEFEVIRATDAEGIITDNLESEVIRASQSESLIAENLTLEAERAVNAEEEISASVLNNKSLTSYNRDYQISPWRSKDSNISTVFYGEGVTHRHFGGIARSANGLVHIVYRKAPEHGTVGEGAIVYTQIYAEGALPSESEIIISPTVSGIDKRDCSIFVTPKGTLIVHFCSLSSTGTGEVSLMYMLSYDDGVTWTEERVYDVSPFSFARSYGQVALIPKRGGGYRLAKPTYKQVTSTTYVTGIYYSDDDGETWEEGTPIKPSTVAGAENETAVLFFNADVGIAVTRAAGLNYSYTSDGGLSWSTFIKPSWATNSSYVAPSLNTVIVDGVQYALLGYANRTTNALDWRWVSFDNLDNTGEAFGNNLVSTSVGVMVNASGYQSAVMYPSGAMLSVEFAEFDAPDKSSDVRLAYHNPAKWIRDAAVQKKATWTPTIKGSTVAGTPTYSIQAGRSIRVGDLVTVWFRLVVATKGGLTGQIIIGGLPYPVKAGVESRAALNLSFIDKFNIVGYQAILGYASELTNEVRLIKRSETVFGSFIDTNILDGFTLYGTLTYEANS